MVILLNQHSISPSVGYDSEDVNGQVYDLDKAKECLEAAGYSDSDGDGIVDKDGENLSLTISIANGSSTAEVRLYRICGSRSELMYRLKCWRM